MGGRNSYRSNVCIWLILLAISVSGCSLSKLKTGLMTGAATATLVGATTALSGGAIVPTAVVGGVTAATASALTAESPVKGQPIAVTADTVVNKAPDNFFTLLGKLVGMGGWLLGLVLLLPMVIGWIIPGPLQKVKKKRS